MNQTANITYVPINLISEPSAQAVIPQSAYDAAEKAIELITKPRQGILPYLAYCGKHEQETQYLKNVGIMAAIKNAAMASINGDEIQKAITQDLLFLKIAIFYNEKQLYSQDSTIKEKALEVDGNLVGLVRLIEDETAKRSRT